MCYRNSVVSEKSQNNMSEGKGGEAELHQEHGELLEDFSKFND